MRAIMIIMFFLLLSGCETYRIYYVDMDIRGNNNKVTFEVKADVPKPISIDAEASVPVSGF